jgi:hypothetical protein
VAQLVPGPLLLLVFLLLAAEAVLPEPPSQQQQQVAVEVADSHLGSEAEEEL